MKNKLITISRQYGSGGRQIGELLATRLGIPFYDKEIIRLAAIESGVSGDLFTQSEQKDYFFRDFSASIFLEPSLGDKMYLAQHTVIRSLAQKGPCVIVGRGAGDVLKGVVPLMNVFIYANLETRKRRATEEYGDSTNKIEEHIAAIDKKRAAYYKFYNDVNGRKLENYHICIDSGYSGIENAVAIIEKAYLLN